MHHLHTKSPTAAPCKTVCLLAAAAIGHGWVHAQTLDDVVVSASRAEQRSFDAPAAIQ